MVARYLTSTTARADPAPTRWRWPWPRSASTNERGETDDRVIPASDLEVAVLDRTRAQPRKFSRIGPFRLEALLGDRGPTTSAPGPRSTRPARRAMRTGRPTTDRATTRKDPTRPSRGGDVRPLARTAGRRRDPSRRRRRPISTRDRRPTRRVASWTGGSSDRERVRRHVHVQGPAPALPDEVARYLFRKVVSWGRSSNVFLRNGARLYLDVGSHPEYATPECDDIVELVTHDKAGERVLEGLLVDAEQRLRDEGIAGDVYLFKNNTDSAGNSYGCHENYLVGRHGEFSRLADVLIPFLVTRQIICGAGKVIQTPRGAMYCVSQRAEHIWEGVSSATTRSRPIINTRDEPHADAERYRRLHVIVGDSNMSETTTLLKVGQLRPGAADDRGGRGDARPHDGEPDPGDPRDLPRHDRPPQGAPGQRPRGQRARDPGRVPRQGPRLRRPPRHQHTDRSSRRSTSGSAASKAVESDDLGLVEREIDWVIKWKLHRALPREARPAARPPADRPARPRLPRHPPRSRPLLPAREARGGRRG